MESRAKEHSQFKQTVEIIFCLATEQVGTKIYETDSTPTVLFYLS